MPLSNEMTISPDRINELLANLCELERCIVAFSGGVDSAVVAKAAHLALGNRAIAITALSPSLATGELENAKAVATQIGIRHRILETHEYDNASYRKNSANRCYFCKSELYTRVRSQFDVHVFGVIVNGTNKDDLGDFRPGLQAAEEQQVRSPLVDCGLSKSEVREIAKHWGLPVWDKPASPCLSSRIAYGEEVTMDRLRMVDQAEAWLKSHGFRELRVRYHKGDLARIEVDPAEITRFADRSFAEQVDRTFRDFGFQFVTIDLSGFQSGNMNKLINIEIPAN